MAVSTDKRIVMIAGANGAGKTTFARQFLPHEAQCPRFVNADLIAAGLSPFTPETAAVKAGRLMLERIREYVHAGVDHWAVFDNSGRFPREIDANSKP
jgi:predicted ABC-type ATPase